MTFLAWIAGFGVAGLLFAGGAAAVEPTPTPEPSPGQAGVRILTDEEAQNVVLQPSDLDGSFMVEPGASLGIGPSCLDVLDYLPGGATSASRGLTDDLFTLVLSGVSSYDSVERAGAVLNAAELVARECPEVDVQGTKLAVRVSDGPQVGSDSQFMLTLLPGAELESPLQADLIYQRVGNNFGFVGVFSGDELPPADIASTAQRFHDKLSAASLGEPIPLSSLEKQQAARQMALGETYQGTRSAVTVSVPKPYTPTDSATVEAGRHLVVTATIDNLGTEVMPRDMITSSATCDGIDAPAIIDPTGGLATGPPGDIAGSTVVSWDMGYTVPQEGCELVVTMTYALNDNIHFAGKV